MRNLFLVSLVTSAAAFHLASDVTNPLAAGIVGALIVWPLTLGCICLGRLK